MPFVMQTLDAPRTKALYGADASSLTFDGHKIVRNSDGSGAITKFPVFKAGTFRDSWGEQMTWTPDHLRQMVDNFTLLKSQNIFPNVPVRSDHSLSVDKVIGYLDGLSTDGNLLFADYTVTEPPALDKIARGTYRSRSLEVGMYETNDGALYFPVVYGFAFVDIPAVEGLHSKNEEVRFFSLTTPKPKESDVTALADDRGASRPDADATANVVTTTTTAPAALFSGTTNTLTIAPSTPVAKFRVNGAEVTDVAEVQRHIDALEAFAKETREGNRKAFVSALVDQKKIAATQADALSELVVEMDEAQFGKFKAAYEAAPVLSILAEHGSTQSTQPATSETSEIEILRETVAQHRRAGLTDDDIKKTASYKKLAALTANKD